MPDPVKWHGSLTCSGFGVDSITIPSNLIAVLQAATPKRLQITVFRDGLSLLASGKINVVSGHGIVRFQDVH